MRKKDESCAPGRDPRAPGPGRAQIILILVEKSNYNIILDLLISRSDGNHFRRGGIKSAVALASDAGVGVPRRAGGASKVAFFKHRLGEFARLHTKAPWITKWCILYANTPSLGRTFPHTARNSEDVTRGVSLDEMCDKYLNIRFLLLLSFYITERLNTRGKKTRDTKTPRTKKDGVRFYSGTPQMFFLSVYFLLNIFILPSFIFSTRGTEKTPERSKHRLAWRPQTWLAE